MSHSDNLAAFEAQAAEAQRAADTATDAGERHNAQRWYHATRASEAIYRRLHAPAIAKEERDAAAAAPPALPPAPDPAVSPHLAHHEELRRANPIAAAIYAQTHGFHLHRERAALEGSNKS